VVSLKSVPKTVKKPDRENQEQKNLQGKYKGTSGKNLGKDKKKKHDCVEDSCAVIVLLTGDTGSHMRTKKKAARGGLAKGLWGTANRKGTV